MAQVSIGAHVSTSGGIFTAIERGVAIEAESLQIFPSAPQTWRPTNHKPEAIARFRELREQHGIAQVWVHNIYLANLAAEDPEQLEKSIGSVVNALRVTEAIGAQGVVLHTGSHRGRGFEAVAEQVTGALKRILHEAPGERLLALENTAGQGGTIGARFGELGELLHAVGSPRLAVCLDTCHAFAAGYDIASEAGLAAAMDELESEVGLDRLAVVHANDALMELGSGRDRHENIGDGHIGAEGFRRILAHPAFEGRAFILEVPGIPPEGGGKADGPDLENVRRLRAQRSVAS
ncbi:MAG: deoxyribonuclease IV [Chloroflexi bacterium]|nr:deoxyribonuclease IV [Chloroflexota bacterium]